MNVVFFFKKKKHFWYVYGNLLLDSVLHRHPDTVLAHLLTCITQYYCSDRGTTVSTPEAGAIVGATVDWIKSNNTRVKYTHLSDTFPFFSSPPLLPSSLHLPFLSWDEGARHQRQPYRPTFYPCALAVQHQSFRVDQKTRIVTPETLLVASYISSACTFITLAYHL